MVDWKETWTYTIPEGVTLTVSDGEVKAKGKLGETGRILRDNYVNITQEGKTIKILISKDNKRSKGIVGTWASEIRHLAEGVTKGFEYEMKIDYTHFPMRVSVKGSSVLIENFLGERSPRSAKIIGNTKVGVKGDRVTLTGNDKRDIGETAANIERATKIKGFDLRVFQDGIYLLKG
ncbi:MAG: 50S ribosomal protein L6 [Candidatus Thermoplasmatota archaeon]|nr:50S ribosomal protein L6 [Candidatus Thermoplasmatota archaeon]